MKLPEKPHEKLFEKARHKINNHQLNILYRLNALPFFLKQAW